MSKSLIALVRHFGWTRFQAVVGNSSHWREAAHTLRQRAENNKLDMISDVYFEEPDLESGEMNQLVEETKDRTRSELGGACGIFSFVLNS